MDFMTIIGFVAGIVTIYIVMASGNILHMLINPVAAVLVFGGTISATLIAYPWEVIKQILPSFKFIFMAQGNSEAHKQELIEQIISLSEKARRTTVENLQSDLGNIDNRFLVYGIQMVIDGLEPEVVKDNLDKEILYSRLHSQRISSVFRTMATLAPIFGLLGTLIGVVQVLRNLSDPSSMGNAMAIAITTTFYGIFAANFIFLPIAIKLGEHSENEVVSKELVAEGVRAINAGDLPFIVRKKLNAFILSHLRDSSQSKKGA